MFLFLLDFLCIFWRVVGIFLTLSQYSNVTVCLAFEGICCWAMKIQTNVHKYACILHVKKKKIAFVYINWEEGCVGWLLGGDNSPSIPCVDR